MDGSTREVEVTRLLEELKALEAQKDALSKEIEAAAPAPKITRPKGVGIQAGMGLSKNKASFSVL